MQQRLFELMMLRVQPSQVAMCAHGSRRTLRFESWQTTQTSLGISGGGSSAGGGGGSGFGSGSTGLALRSDVLLMAHCWSRSYGDGCGRAPLGARFSIVRTGFVGCCGGGASSRADDSILECNLAGRVGWRFCNAA